MKATCFLGGDFLAGTGPGNDLKVFIVKVGKSFWLKIL